MKANFETGLKICSSSKCGLKGIGQLLSSFCKCKSKSDGFLDECKKCSQIRRKIDSVKLIAKGGFKFCSSKDCEFYRTEQSINNFTKNKSRKDGFCSICKECVKRMENKQREKRLINYRKRKLKNPNYDLERSLKCEYGISIKDKENKLKDQNFKCAIKTCNKKLSIRCDTDHIHGTKIVRGLLCRKHNLAIGFVSDSIDECYAIIDYLSKFNKERNI